jgi:uncharacterized protein (DUF2147 family)
MGSRRRQGEGALRKLGGDAVCGSISWLRDPNNRGKVGQQVFFDMKPLRDNAWTGSAFNQEDGKTYSGKHTLSSLLQNYWRHNMT